LIDFSLTWVGLKILYKIGLVLKSNKLTQWSGHN